MSIVCLLQARTNSTRLPAKVLLPIADIPLVVLATKRAENSGLTVKVVTSIEASDDHLCQILEDHNINFFRGNLNNTLKRFVDALAGCLPDTIVVRLTGDNVFPDGKFIEDVVNHFKIEQLNYISTTGNESGLPYGLSAEVFYLRDIREAITIVQDDYSKEHVTPYIIKKFGKRVFQQQNALGLAHISCTIDTLDEYTKINNLFSKVNNPIEISSVSLSHLLKSEIDKIQLKQLIIGGAQLGSAYGVNNNSGQLSIDECEELFLLAKQYGIECVDTAYAYGESEACIGEVFKRNTSSQLNVITKLSPIEATVNRDNETLVSHIENCFEESIVALKSKKLYGVLLHRAQHLFHNQQVIWKFLQDKKKLGVVDKIGVSVQSPQELILILSQPSIDIIQLPCNLLDHRWENVIKNIIDYQKEYPLEIHIRSVFLQGLILSKNEQHWRSANINEQQIIKVKKWLENVIIKCNRLSLADLCIAYIKAQPWVSKIVIGMDNNIQLQENTQLFINSPLTEKEVEYINSTRPKLLENFLNPALWKNKK